MADRCTCRVPIVRADDLANLTCPEHGYVGRLERERDEARAERDAAARALDAAVVRAQRNEVRAIETQAEVERLRDDISRCSCELQDEAARGERLREALKFYAEARNYTQGHWSKMSQKTVAYIDLDGGSIARRALAPAATGKE